MRKRGWAGRFLLVAMAVSAVLVAGSTTATITASACTPPKCGGGGGDPGISFGIGGRGSVQEGSVVQFTGLLTDSDPAALASEYTAFFSWGDGSPGDFATIAPTSGIPGGRNPGNAVQFAVTASHAFRDAGSFPVSISVRDKDLPNPGGAVGFTQTVDEAPISMRGLTDALVNPYCDAVAAINDSNPLAFAGDYTATIDWGDGTTSGGTVQPDSLHPGNFWVYGCHTYAGLGPHTVSTTVADAPIQVSATGTAWVYAVTDGGTFVIGDGNAAVGNTVVFWGGPWAESNTLSGGDASSAFKGFAPGRSPICVGAWASPPGGSSNPPATVPSYTAVLVSSSMAKHGSTIDGNSIHIALVRTDPGYGPTTDQSGTGAVVFMIC